MPVLQKQISDSDAQAEETPQVHRQQVHRLLSPKTSHLDIRAVRRQHQVIVQEAKPSRYFGFALACMIGASMIAANLMNQPSEIDPIKTSSIASSAPTPKIVVPAGLKIMRVQLRKVLVNRNSVALVQGQIVNNSQNKMRLPQLDIVLRRKDGQKVTSWRHRPFRAFLGAGETVTFKSKAGADVNSDSVIGVRFVSENSSRAKSTR